MRFSGRSRRARRPWRAGLPPCSARLAFSAAPARRRAAARFRDPGAFAIFSRSARISSTSARSLLPVRFAAPRASRVRSASFASISAMRSSLAAPRSRSRASACLLALQRGDRDFGVLDRRRLGVLADRDARAGRVEQAHRLVGQLPRRNVAVREIHRRDDRLVGDAHLVVLLHRRRPGRAA